MKIVARIATALARVCAVLSQIAWVPIRLADGTIDWIRRLVVPPAAYMTPDVQEAIGEVQEADQLDGIEDSRRAVGELVRRAAAEVLEHGVVLSPDVPVGVKNWIVSLDRNELRALSTAEPLSIAAHVSGEVVLADRLGLPIPAPAARRDAEVAAERAEVRRRREAARRPSAPARRPASSMPALVL